MSKKMCEICGEKPATVKDVENLKLSQMHLDEKQVESLDLRWKREPTGKVEWFFIFFNLFVMVLCVDLSYSLLWRTFVNPIPVWLWWSGIIIVAVNLLVFGIPLLFALVDQLSGWHFGFVRTVTYVPLTPQPPRFGMEYEVDGFRDEGGTRHLILKSTWKKLQRNGGVR